jgi:5-methyltetrahydrofolate--homocysteine methyltransferase
MGDDGIQVDVEKRVEAAVRIHDKTVEFGIDDEHLYFDPLVMPLGTDPQNPMLTLRTGMRIKEMFPDVHLTMGLSNISHGLPDRRLLNRVFLTLAMQAGFDSAIIDPCDTMMLDTLKAADSLLGNDDFCMNYIQYIKSRQ